MKGKHFAKAYWSRTRIVSVVLSIVLLFGCITFTSAWLIAKNEEGPVVNQFTGSSLEISLSPDGDQGPYKLVPGMTYDLGDKAPEITVEAGSVECYLFAVLIEDWGVYDSDNPQKNDHYYKIDDFGEGKFLNSSYNLMDMQTVYGDTSVYKVLYYGTNNNYYVETSNDPQTFKVIETLSIPADRTKDEVAPEAFANGKTPKFTVEAYSIQTLGFKGKNKDDKVDEKGVTTTKEQLDVMDAWKVVKAAILADNTQKVVLD